MAYHRILSTVPCVVLFVDGKTERRLNSTTLLHLERPKALKFSAISKKITEVCCQHFPEKQPPPPTVFSFERKRWAT